MPSAHLPRPPHPCCSPRPALTAAPAGLCLPSRPQWPVTGSLQTCTAVGQDSVKARTGAARPESCLHTCAHTHNQSMRVRRLYTRPCTLT